MISYYLNDFNIKQSDTQHHKIKSFLNQINELSKIENSNIKLIMGIVNEYSELKFYIRVDENYEYLIKERFKIIFPSISFESFNFNKFENIVSEKSSCRQMDIIDLKNENVNTNSLEPSQIFIESLMNEIYFKDLNDFTLIEFEISSCTNVKKSKTEKALNITSKVVGFLVDSIMFNSSNDNTPKPMPIGIQNEKLNVCIRIISSNDKLDQNTLDKRTKSISSVFSQLNNKRKYTSYDVDRKKIFNNNKYFKLTIDEILCFLYLPEKKTMENVMGTSELNVLIDKNIPQIGIHIGDYGNNKYYISTPTIILNKKDYSEIYKSSSKINNNNINNSQIIDNLCKTRFIEGVPGTGKSETINNLCISGLERGVPFILIDPKYDTQKRLIESIPDKYLDSIDFLDLGDLLYPPALNIFRKRKQDDVLENALITTNFIGYMRKQFDRNWGYNIERMIQMTTDAILLDDITTVSEFYWMLTEEAYRKNIIGIIEYKLEDENVENRSRLKQLLKYWRNFQERYEKSPITVNKEIETVLNKIGVFIGNRFINAIVSQRESYDFKYSGDMGKSVIVNIPEGLISTENMSLLSGFVTKAIWADYQSRDDMDMDKRYPVQWILDEASTLINDEVINIMQKSRSRRLGLTLVFQTLDSLNIKGMNMANIIMDNCKTKLVYRIGYSDANKLIGEFAPLNLRDLTDCPDYHFYGKVLLPNGRVSNPFFAKTPNPHPVLRDYDEYKNKLRSGKMTIREIEDDIDARLERFIVADELMK